jgi:Phosphotransferase enzyme family
MTAALQRDLPGVEVEGVEVISRDDGTNRRARLGVSYADGAGPEVVFVKGEGAYRESHARNGNMFNEPELFAARLPLPVDHPHPYHVAIDRPALDYVIVMEDVTRRGADPCYATRPMTVEQVEDGVRHLAALHSAYWDLSTTHPGLGWLQTWQATAGWRQSLGPGVPIGIERAADVLPPEVLAIPSDDLLLLCMRSIATFGTGRLTLLHADPHVGNTYVLPGDQVGFLDWQVCRRGNWAQDLAYFMVSALTVADRRDSERRLLDSYRDALTLASHEKPGPEEVWLRYASAHPYGLAVWLATHQSDRSQRADVCRALIERYAAAFLDGESADALDRLEA